MSVAKKKSAIHGKLLHVMIVWKKASNGVVAAMSTLLKL